MRQTGKMPHNAAGLLTGENTLIVKRVQDMDITPNDLRSFEFQTQMRGYDRDEVRKLLDQAATALEKAKQEHLRLSMETDSLKTQLAGLRQFEDSIKNAAIDARRNADQTIANAKREAEAMMNTARAEAEKVVGSRASKIEEFETKIAGLEKTYQSYQSKIRELITSHLAMVDSSMDEQTIITTSKTNKKHADIAPLEVTESEDITTRGRNTFASQPTKSEPVRREEANAPDRIVAKAYTPPTGPEPKKMTDPELEQSIGQYTKHAAQATTPTAPTTPATSKIPTQQFSTVHQDPTPARGESTGKLNVSNNFSNESAFEHSNINIDAAADEPTLQPGVPSPSANTDNLAEELDRVVAKFEEEMNKAEKN